MNLQIKKDFNSGEYYLSLDDVIKGFDISANEIDSYEMIWTDTGICLVLYDNDGNAINLNLRKKP